MDGRTGRTVPLLARESPLPNNVADPWPPNPCIGFIKEDAELGDRKL